MGKRRPGSMLVLLSVLLVAGSAAPHPISVGHRGGSVDRPENTIPTYDYSLASGVDWVELDVWLSLDGVPVCHHDERLERTTDGTGPIHQKTLAELEALDAGSWFSPAYAGTELPSVAEVLPFVEGRGKLLLDIKDVNYVPTVVQTLTAAGFPPEDVVVWNRFGTGPPFAALMPGASVLSALVRTKDWDQQLGERKAAGDLGVSERYQEMTPELVDLIHSYGLLVATNTLVSPVFQQQIDLGVDVLIASNPVALEALLPAYTPECMDGLDNDSDGLTDHPLDPGCFAPEDDREYKACSDGIDNDGDGLVDHPDDPGCFAPFYPLENPACDDGVDNNGDGQVDYPLDGGCLAPHEQFEQFPCENGLDDDGDGTVDHPEDLGCESVWDGDERGASTACDNGIDDDGNGFTDYPDEPGCRGPSDPSEQPDCSDGVDNDLDGFVDFGFDPGCEDEEDGWERGASAACDNGIDDDGDASVDFPDETGCRDPLDSTEAPDCSDGIDNDLDGLVDFGSDPGCASGQDGWERGASTTCDNGIDDDLDTFVDFPDDLDCLDAHWIHEVPEPAALVQLAAGGALLGILRRRRAGRGAP